MPKTDMSEENQGEEITAAMKTETIETIGDTNNMMNYYRIEVRAAHLAHISEKESLYFYFKARSVMDAIRLARQMPGVKHSRADTVQSVKQITQEEYRIGRQESAYTRRNNGNN